MKKVKLLALSIALFLAAGQANSAGRDIYPDPAQARADIAAALKTAAATHKRILLDFGGNWCGDCQVLDIYFHDPDQPAHSRSQLRPRPRQHRAHGRQPGHRREVRDSSATRACPRWPSSAKRATLLYSQKSGEFEAMRHMESSAVTELPGAMEARQGRLLGRDGELLKPEIRCPAESNDFVTAQP